MKTTAISILCTMPDLATSFPKTPLCDVAKSTANTEYDERKFVFSKTCQLL